MIACRMLIGPEETVPNCSELNRRWRPKLKSRHHLRPKTAIGLGIGRIDLPMAHVRGGRPPTGFGVGCDFEQAPAIQRRSVDERLSRQPIRISGQTWDQGRTGWER